MLHLTRRQFLRTTAAGAAALVLTPRIVLAQAKGPYTLPPLPYAYDALKKAIDEETMKIHHGRHHQAYVDNLNKAIEKAPDWKGKPIEEVLRNIDKIPKEIRQAVINNGGGHANHTLFWEVMGPQGGGQPKGKLADAIQSTFGSFEKFQDELSQSAMNRFGSGWAWLVVDGGKLRVYSTANQDSPLMQGHTPILGIDVWEHAYYLRYQNRRGDYVKAWWTVVNWDNVSQRFDKAMKG
ncbi:MAG TPA: Fe-Mn family superoxide dismutase [Gemmataceae bacterium]|nr:Fe-Mn family superoxide dismutase [Gemmataceae bacterium]